MTGQEQNEIERSLGRIEGHIEGMRREIRDSMLYTRSLSDRIRSLEVFRGWVTGLGAFAATVLGYFKWGGN